MNPDRLPDTACNWSIPDDVPLVTVPCRLLWPGQTRRHLPYPAPSAENFNAAMSLAFAPVLPPRQRVNPWQAALSAQDIPYRKHVRKGRTILWIPRPYLSQAQEELIAYETVNANWPRHRPNQPTTDILFDHWAVGHQLLLQALLCRFFLWLEQTRRFDSWQAAGRWDASAIANGEWWRCITALTLHADHVHLASNLLWGALYGSLVATRLGTGVTLCLMLGTGFLGNATMYVLEGRHRSLGASTMIFGLLGVLAASHALNAWQVREKGRGLIRLIPAVPLAFAVAMAATTGAAPGADALAHACGFLWGLLLGALCHVALPQKPKASRQLLLATGSLAIVLLAWYFAVRIHALP